mmetsp:Transcript_86401/g.244937  ORF Transcript_86401/g.244937 Transcript_86401/m.244937 type:complete len:200 (-) Transcript_86401:8-607(-)
MSEGSRKSSAPSQPHWWQTMMACWADVGAQVLADESTELDSFPEASLVGGAGVGPSASASLGIASQATTPGRIAASVSSQSKVSVASSASASTASTAASPSLPLHSLPLASGASAFGASAVSASGQASSPASGVVFAPMQGSSLRRRSSFSRSLSFSFSLSSSTCRCASRRRPAALGVPTAQPMSRLPAPPRPEAARAA